MKTDFWTWSRENLLKFAGQATQKILEQDLEIKELKKDLKAAINAYRQLNKGIKK